MSCGVVWPELSKWVNQGSESNGMQVEVVQVVKDDI